VNDVPSAASVTAPTSLGAANATSSSTTGRSACPPPCSGVRGIAPIRPLFDAPFATSTNRPCANERAPHDRNLQAGESSVPPPRGKQC
jgi:hypothetical protein